MDTDSPAPDTRSLAAYLDELRSGAPTPGGGSAAAYVGALGAALLAMVCRLTLNSPSHGADEELADAATRLDGLVDQLSLAAREDERCYGRYREAASLPKSTGDEKQIRREAMQHALVLAARSPLESARLAIDALREAPLVARVGTIHALSDVQTALELLPASVRGSIINVDVNIAMITNPDLTSELNQARTAIEAELNLSVQNTVDALSGRQES